MQSNRRFVRAVCDLAIPVTLQSMLQSSFSIVDQIMIGQLGSVSVAGVGLAGKFSSIFSVLASAIGAIAGIMISQYIGQRNQREVRRSFCVNLLLSAGIAAIFTLLCALFPRSIMGLYAQDADTISATARYLSIIAGTFVPMAGAAMLSALFRCMEKAKLPLYAGIVGAVLNTGLNYILIFGRLGLPAMGAQGAAIATLVSQIASFLIMLVMLLGHRDMLRVEAGAPAAGRFHWRQYAAMLLPLLVCELMWSLGENVYAGIYGHLGTDSCAAMTLINPVQGLMTGALCGLSQAAGVIVGKGLGEGDCDGAYVASKRLMRYGAIASLCIGAAIVFARSRYVEIYRVEAAVKALAEQILLAYAAVAPFKVLNMILGGGILRSGGKTKYTMIVDLIGTWLFGVPLGLLAAFGLHLRIPWVYFILSLEECVRFGISIAIFRGRDWMQRLEN